MTGLDLLQKLLKPLGAQRMMAFWSEQVQRRWWKARQTKNAIAGYAIYWSPKAFLCKMLIQNFSAFHKTTLSPVQVPLAVSLGTATAVAQVLGSVHETCVLCVQFYGVTDTHFLQLNKLSAIDPIQIEK